MWLHIFGPMEAGFTSAQLTSMFRGSCGTAALDGGIDTATSEVRARARPLPRKLPASSCSRGLCDSHRGALPILRRKPARLQSIALRLSRRDGYLYYKHPRHLRRPHLRLPLSPRAELLHQRQQRGWPLRPGRSGSRRTLSLRQVESTGVLPNLDACGGHWGTTPDGYSYHYHVQTKAPFTIGCYGPNADNSVVTLAQCRAVYSGCSSTAVTYNVQTGTTWPKTLTGTVSIKLWCPCYDADGSNTGTNALPCEEDPTATGCKKAAEETQALSYQPALN